MVLGREENLDPEAAFRIDVKVLMMDDSSGSVKSNDVGKID